MEDGDGCDGDVVVRIRAATNDYFNNRLICRLFFWLIDESDKKTKNKKSIHFQPFIQKQN